jgi:hypothetical protein
MSSEESATEAIAVSAPSCKGGKGGGRRERR